MLKILQYFNEKGADIEAKTNFNKLLSLLHENGHLSIVKYLIEKRPDIEAKVDKVILIFILHAGMVIVLKLFNI